MLDGFGAEEAFFKQHPTYGKDNRLYQDRLGVPNLTRFLSHVLIDRLRQHLPAILAEVTQLYQVFDDFTPLLGEVGCVLVWGL